MSVKIISIYDPNNPDITIPKESHGPKGTCDFLLALPLIIEIIMATLPTREPIKTAIRFICHPRQSPEAATSLISPPPMAPPFDTIATIRKGTLTEKMPITRDVMVVP